MDWEQEETETGDIENVVVTSTPGHITRGKYKGLVLPKMLAVKPDYQARVDALKNDIAADPEFKQHASWLATEYAALRREKSTIQEQLSDCDLRLEAIAQMMTEQFEAEDTHALTTKHGDNIRIQPEPHAVVMDADQCRAWCIKEGLAPLMKLPWATLNKLTKERLLDTLPEPEGVTAYFRNKIVFKRG